MLDRGAEWHRWEPHIHAPGTLFNDLFGGPDPWKTYLAALESCAPTIRAIAVTDYYIPDVYEKFLAFKNGGRLPDVKLIFPNVEVRLDVAAKKGFVNLHLLVSPEDPSHLVEVRRFLSRLKFDAHGDSFSCSRDDLVRLGKRADSTIRDDHAALVKGAEQFKVHFSDLRDEYGKSDWAKENILIAVAGGTNDGTAGLQQASDKTLREEIEKFAHIIFSGSPAQREFWLGQRSVSVADLQKRYNGCKPCLHGSDAHEHAKVGRVDDDRFCWIKGEIAFDTLRQAQIDPEGRTHIGAEPPQSATPSQVISAVTINDAPWATTPQIPLNPGLVAIIGARGSGKTALADLIAAGCDAIPPSAWKSDENITPSFIVRAQRLITDVTVDLTWGSGETTTCGVLPPDEDAPPTYVRARYLSQQFVEELCSSKGVSDGLIAEIERVIFEAHSQDDREGAIDFADFREQRTARHQNARQREAEAIATISERIADESAKEASVALLLTQVTQKKGIINNYTKDRAKLVVGGTDAQAKRHAELNAAAEALRQEIQSYSNQRRIFVAMQDEVASTRATKAPEMLRMLQARYQNNGLDDAQWDQFLLIYKGQVDKSLAGYIKWADKKIADLTGTQPPAPADPKIPFIADDADLSTCKLLPLVAEMDRLQALLGANKKTREQYQLLTTRLTQENAALKTLEKKLEDCQGAQLRKKQLQLEREEAYCRVFEAVIAEQAELENLYAPLMTRLGKEPGTLGKLSLSVRRVADVQSWAEYAEQELIDLRKSGPLQRRGSLVEIAKNNLKAAWETGTAADVQAAMSKFIADYYKALTAHAPYSPKDQTDFRTWLRNFALWLFGTDHISVRYEIAYDGVDIRKLSPGTRGIVLLLLYLALDDGDDRPLIIDQPEENLDPKSVFEELVPLFVTAKSKRQVIMVTHNANLVVNTDAEQVIIAQAGPHMTGGLPPISYTAGGLEVEAIRAAVCDILEGGEEAFKERARRLRVRLER